MIEQRPVLNLLKCLACIGEVLIHVNFPGLTGGIVYFYYNY